MDVVADDLREAYEDAADGPVRFGSIEEVVRDYEYGATVAAYLTHPILDRPPYGGGAVPRAGHRWDRRNDRVVVLREKVEDLLDFFFDPTTVWGKVYRFVFDLRSDAAEGGRLEELYEHHAQDMNRDIYIVDADDIRPYLDGTGDPVQDTTGLLESDE